MIIPEDVQKAIEALERDAEACDLTTTAVHFFGGAKDGLAQDIRTVLRFIKGFQFPDD